MTDQKHEYDCPNCGGTEYQPGWMHPVGQTRTIKFTPDKKSSWLGFAGVDIRAKRCKKCGRLDLFASDDNNEGTT